MRMPLPSRITSALAWRKQYWRERLNLFLASNRRRLFFKTTFVGITGSVGKTTAKDLTLAVLKQKGSAEGNSMGLNYLDDMARTILKLPRNLCFVVLEIATSGPGTIDPRVRLCRPQIAAMTVIGRDHIKKFGSMEAIAEEKAKLIMALPNHGTAVLNRDDPLIRAVSEKTQAKKLWFGTAVDADLRLLEASSNYPEPLILKLGYKGSEYICPTSIYGTQLSIPTLTALGIGLAAGLSIEQAIAGLAIVQTTPGRMQIVVGTGGVTFLRDDFKAPHWTFPAILEFLKNAQAKRKIAVIGTLSDYSQSASKIYPKVARQLREVADLVVFVGPHALRALKARTGEDDESLRGFDQIQDAHRFLEQELREGDLVVLKGSNRADHLVRLFLARERPVTCWIRDCGKNRFCDQCERIDRQDVVAEQPLAESSEIDGASCTSNAFLVVGLGNPGDRYANTPHNIGSEVLDRLAERLQKNWVDVAYGKIVESSIDGCEVILMKPGAYMNNSGTSVHTAQHAMGIDRRRIIVIHDDTDLLLSEVRLKHSGSDGGHKGLRSIFSALGNDGFMPRIRVGVQVGGKATQASRTIVLEHFESADKKLVDEALDKAVELLKKSLRESAAAESIGIG